MIDYPVDKIRSDFPILLRKINNCSLIYLDNASSAHKPNFVIDGEMNFYRNNYSSVYRGVHTLSNESTIEIENVRKQVSYFINSKYINEIVFVKGTTYGINLVANSLCRTYFKSGDNIIITEMEHHSNIVPWKVLSKDKNIELRIVPLLPDGNLNFSCLKNFVDSRTRFFSVTHISNVLGTINPLRKIIKYIRSLKEDIIILVDGAQSVAHCEVDVQNLDCDFYVFSGHKIYGPSGIGVLYGKKKFLQYMPPWEVGGGIVNIVNLKDNKSGNFGVTYVSYPWKFEVGSINNAGIIGLGCAISYINSVGLKNILNWEKFLMRYALKQLKKVPNIIIYGIKEYCGRSGIISFNLSDFHAYDVGLFLDQNGIAVRAGHQCALPIMSYFGISSVCRISLAMYNTINDIDCLVKRLINITKLMF